MGDSTPPKPSEQCLLPSDIKCKTFSLCFPYSLATPLSFIASPPFLFLAPPSHSHPPPTLLLLSLHPCYSLPPLPFYSSFDEESKGSDEESDGPDFLPL